MDNMTIFDFEGLDGEIFPPEHYCPEISGFDEYSELSNQGIEQFVNTLIPEGHLDNCASITCNPDDPIWLEVPGALGYHFEPTEGAPTEICLAGRELLENYAIGEVEVLCHEIGHNAYNNLSLENQIRWSELHAESETLYANPTLLQFISPEKYEFMREQVFGGLEYGSVSSSDGDNILVTKDVEGLVEQLETTGAETAVASNEFASSANNPLTDGLFRCFNKIA